MADRRPPPPTQIRPEVWLDARRALWLSRLRILVVADVHWGYAVSHRARGNLLPVWGDEEIAGRLASLLADYEPGEMIWLGDSLHALPGRRAAEIFLERPGLPPTVVLSGNHDLRWSRASVASAQRDGFFFHHGDAKHAVPEGCVEVVGHHHPAVLWDDGAGGRLKMPALVDGPRRLIMPAFSPWAGGTPWKGMLRADETLWAVAPQRVFQLR
ncbi:MAG: metallophosphoesterase [Verrucomicrobia bacterium]|nr:metallophosphoesterase [Verrucomicrobiota bacterium]